MIDGRIYSRRGYKEEMRKILSIISLVKFIWYTIRYGNFGKGDPKVSLLILAKYLTLNSFSYSTERRMGRSLRTSVNLLNILINRYIENSSPTCLNQALCVYVEEFLNRKVKNGRK